MVFCWRCGAEVERAEASFCAKCGADLLPKGKSSASIESPTVGQQGSKGEEMEESPRVSRLNAYGLGKQFEENVALIFRNMGYQVETRHHFHEMGGAEIDLVLSRGNRRVAVECKNYDESRDVGIKDLRDFKGKLDQIEIASGIFVAATFFSDPAKEFAHQYEIALWDKNELNERMFALMTGRGKAETAETIKALRVGLDFAAASSIHIRNKQAVRLFSAALLYHPYHLIKYRVYGKRKDPAGKVHKIVDEGLCVVDGLDGEVINESGELLDSLKGFLKSKQERVERKEDKLISTELLSSSPTKEMLKKNSDFDVRVIEPQTTLEEANRNAIEYAVEKNTRTVNYEPKRSSEGLFGDIRTMKVVPKREEVTIRGQSTVYVPKWDLQFESGQRTYQRRYLASSGATIVDDLAKCRKCTLIHKPTVAVCDVCGMTLCEKHTLEEGGGLLCEEHVSAQLRESLKSKSLTSKLFRRR